MARLYIWLSLQARSIRFANVAAARNARACVPGCIVGREKDTLGRQFFNACERVLASSESHEQKNDITFGARTVVDQRCASGG